VGLTIGSRLEGCNVAWVSTAHAPPSAANDGDGRRGCGRRPCHRARAPSRAGRRGQARRAASGLGRALLFGQQGRLGATLAIEDLNAAGGIKALGGAKIEAVLGDAQSTPEGGNAEVEKMNSAGVAAIVGGYASSICLTASQTAARYDLPYLVDVG